MRVSPERLATEAEATGFQPEVLEKSYNLLGLLDAIDSHPFLRGRPVPDVDSARASLYIFT